jgi:hypothetical protein
MPMAVPVKRVENLRLGSANPEFASWEGWGIPDCPRCPRQPSGNLRDEISFRFQPMDGPSIRVTKQSVFRCSGPLLDGDVATNRVSGLESMRWGFCIFPGLDAVCRSNDQMGRALLARPDGAGLQSPCGTLILVVSIRLKY